MKTQAFIRRLYLILLPSIEGRGRRTCEQKNIQLHLIKNLPIGSGLGSSASSVVASLSALNYFYNKLLNPDELLILMGQMEEKISANFILLFQRLLINHSH